MTVTRADAWGCAVILENSGERRFTPDPAEEGREVCTLLRRNALGNWVELEPIRPATGRRSAPALEGSLSPDSETGDSVTWGWDWSYAYGPLEPGDYCIQLTGSFGVRVRKDPAYVRGYFTLTGEEPGYPGPLSLCGMPEGLTSSLVGGPSSWVQTLDIRGLGWAVENDYSLFRLTEDGELTFISPSYCRRGKPSLLNGVSRKDCDVDLSARYAYLEAGSYVLRRRVLRYTWEEQEARAEYTCWLAVPEERLEFADTVFTLLSPVREAS